MSAIFRTLICVTVLLATTSANGQELETTTVTGKRQTADLYDLGINTGAVSESELALIAHTHLAESLSRVPGTWISRGNGQEHLTALRSPVLTGAGACGAFLMAEDGLALRATGFCNLNQLFEANTEQAQRIEVVRGPGSSLYGSNAMHGMINVLSYAAPESNASSIGLEFGTDEYFRVRLHQALKSGRHSLRIYGNGASDGGYQPDSGFDQQKLNVSHYYEGDSVSIKNHLSLTNLNQETAGFIRGRDAYKDQSVRRDNPNPEAFRDAQSARFYSRIEMQLDDQATLVVRPYLRHSEMRFLQHFLPWQPVEENGVDSVGLQLQYNNTGSVIDLSAGLDLEYSDGYLEEIQAQPFSPTLPAGVHYDYDVTSTIVSPYANIVWRASEQLQLDASIRFDSTEYDYDNLTNSNFACAAGVTGCRFVRPNSRSDRFEDWSPSLAAVYRWADTGSAYLRISRGFRAPQATELYRLQAGQLQTDLNSVQLDSIELGFRGEAGKIRYDIALFSMSKDDFIFQDSNRQNISGGESSHEGIEVELRLALSDQLSLAASGSYAKHEYSNEIQISSASIDGNDIDTAPRHTGNVRLLWNNQGALNAELEWNHLGSYFQNPENTVKYPGHNLLNARASYRFAPGWQASIRVVNLLDTDYAERADFGFGSDRYFVGKPRGAFLSVQWDM